MPEKNGIEVLKQMKEENSPVKVLILTVHTEMDYLMKAVDIGVDGYILKDSESSELKKQSKLSKMEKIIYSLL